MEEELKEIQKALDVAAQYKLSAEVVFFIIKTSQNNPKKQVTEILTIALAEWDLL